MENLPAVFLFLTFLIGVFIICRELVCWYWKQNELVSVLKDIRFSLEQIQDSISPAPKKSPAKKASNVPGLDQSTIGKYQKILDGFGEQLYKDGSRWVVALSNGTGKQYFSDPNELKKYVDQKNS